MSEAKVQKFIEPESVNALIGYTAKYFVKSFPKSLRQDSSNYCPIPAWIRGIQAVALNMQTFDENLDLNMGLFRINGNCGYILKPKILREGRSKL